MTENPPTIHRVCTVITSEPRGEVKPEPPDAPADVKTLQAALGPYAVQADEHGDVVNLRVETAQLAAHPKLRPVLLRLRHVHSLDVSGQEIDSFLAGIKSWSGLGGVGIKGDVSDEGLAVLDGMAGIWALSVNDCPRITDEGLRHVGKLKELEFLSLQNCAIRGPGLRGLAGLTKLRKLDLYRNLIGDEGLRHLKRLKLEDLNLDSTGITDAGLVYLRGATNLRTLMIDDTQITDGGLVNLKGMKRLEYLYLEQTRVSNKGLRHLVELNSLRFLDLRETDVTDAGMPSIARLPALENLDLDNDRITDAGLAYLPRCRRLRQVALRKTDVTDAGVKYFAALPLLNWAAPL